MLLRSNFPVQISVQLDPEWRQLQQCRTRALILDARKPMCSRRISEVQYRLVAKKRFVLAVILALLSSSFSIGVEKKR